MILGDPIIFGGSGGPSSSDAILTVTVPTGSTVTMTKGGVTLTPTMWVQAADNMFDCALFVIVPSMFDAQNPWTVMASLSSNTANATVTIGTNKQYDLTIVYDKVLYNALTQDATVFDQLVNRYGLTINQGTDYIYVWTGAHYQWFAFKEPCDLSKYSYVVLDGWSSGDSGQRWFGVSRENSSNPNGNAYANIAVSSESRTLTYLDISSITSTGYVYFMTGRSDIRNNGFGICKVYLKA